MKGPPSPPPPPLPPPVPAPVSRPKRTKMLPAPQGPRPRKIRSKGKLLGVNRVKVRLPEVTSEMT